VNRVDGWEKKRLDECGMLVSGSTPSTSTRSFWNGEIVWVTPNDLSKLNTPYLHNSERRITEKGLRGCSAHLLPAGSLVVSSRAPIGYVAIAEVPFCTNQGCKALAPGSAFYPEFVYYNVLFNIDTVKRLGEGTTFAEISKAALSRVELSFPTAMAEQTRIAEILSTVDRAIEQTEALIAKQQRIKTGLIEDLLTRGIDEQGNLRSEETHRFKDSPLGRIPVEWEINTLNGCVRDGSPICYGILMPGTGSDDGIPVIKVKDISGGQILQNQLLLTDPKIDSHYRRSRLRMGDLLLSIRGTTGRIAIVPPELEGANITQDTARVRLKEVHSKQYFYFLLQSMEVQDQIQLHALGQAVKGINIAEVRNISFALPGKHEQRLIAERLSKVEGSVSMTSRQLRKLRSLKTGLMQDLLTGRVRVTALLSDSEVMG
jgi:type I restriction enzyme S subunit